MVVSWTGSPLASATTALTCCIDDSCTSGSRRSLCNALQTDATRVTRAVASSPDPDTPHQTTNGGGTVSTTLDRHGHDAGPTRATRTPTSRRTWPRARPRSTARRTCSPATTPAPRTCCRTPSPSSTCRGTRSATATPSTATSAGSWSTRTTRCGAGRGSAASTRPTRCPRPASTTPYDDGMGGAAVVVRRRPCRRGSARWSCCATTSSSARPRSPTCSASPSAPSSRRPAAPSPACARAHPAVPRPPRVRRRPMNHTPLEDQVHDALHRRVDPLQHAPLTVDDVRRRARRIQRAAARSPRVAVAAVLAVAIPVGLSATRSRPAQRGAARRPSPPRRRRLRHGPRRPEQRRDASSTTTVPLLDVDGPSLITPDGTTGAAGDLRRLTPYGDGLGRRRDRRGCAVRCEFLRRRSRRRRRSRARPAASVDSPDGTRVAWSEYDGSRWQVVERRRRRAKPRTGTRRSRRLHRSRGRAGRASSPGTTSSCGRNDSVETKTYVVRGGRPVEVTGRPAAGVRLGRHRPGRRPREPRRGDGTCSAVVDGGGPRLWETCDYGLGRLSPDGTYVVGTDPEADGYGSPTVSVLDAEHRGGDRRLRGGAAPPHGRRVLDTGGLGGRRGARGPDLPRRGLRHDAARPRRHGAAHRRRQRRRLRACRWPSRW